MTFLTSDDLDSLVRDDHRLEIANMDPDLQEDLQDLAEQKAIAEASDYLRARWDVAADFAKTGSDRSLMLVHHTAALALFFLHLRILTNQVPKYVFDLRNEAVLWLEECRDAKRNPDLTPITDDDGEVVEQPNLVRFSRRGDSKRRNYL